MLDKTTEETTEVVTSFKALIGKVEQKTKKNIMKIIIIITSFKALIGKVELGLMCFIALIENLFQSLNR